MQVASIRDIESMGATPTTLDWQIHLKGP